MIDAISPEEAAALIPDGATIMIGGFMGVGTPNRLVHALAASDSGGFTIVANDTARSGTGVGPLITAKKVKKLITSHIGVNPDAQAARASGEMEVELVPQGTFVERVRAGGVGLGGVLTATGLGTPVEDGKPTIEVNGKTYLVEPPITADFALIAARQSDHFGNLDYTMTARNFNPIMAMAATTVIAEPREIVPVGVIPPDGVMTPGVLVDYIVEWRA